MSRAKQAEREMLKPPTKDSKSIPCLSVGVSLLNLACSGRVDVALAKGHCYRLCGRSAAGKTWIARSILAEAANNPLFDGYELIYDDVEGGALMGTERYFGKRLAERLSPPAKSVSKEPIYSSSITDFYSRIRKRLNDGKKLIWVEDSLDSLLPGEKQETKMGDGKAKVNSQELRKLLPLLQETESILVLVSQAKTDLRSTIGQDTTSGGRSPEFYSTLEIWLRKTKPIVTTYKEKKYPVGITIAARVKKNRLTGQDRTVEFPFYPSAGIDDVGANVNFLCSVNHWSKVKGRINAEEFGAQGSTEWVIQAMEGREKELSALVEKVWKEIEEATAMKRKCKYD
jgi:hypothetical protein